MSLTSSEALFASQHDLFAYVQVAATTAALYDHALSFGQEVDLIWKTPASFAAVLYIIDRYVGNAVLLAGIYLCFAGNISEEECLRLFQFRTWGTVAYSWAAQAIMQLRIYAMYGRSKKILALLLFFFIAEVASIAAVVWQAIGPNSSFHVTLQGSMFSSEQYCMFSGVNGNFTFLFIPVVCFEILLFVLAAKVYYVNIRNRRMSGIQGEGGAFMRVLARDSLYYFSANLVMCAVVMGLWESVAARYANICIPLVMLFEIIVGTRLVINFRERFSRPDRTSVVLGWQAPARHDVRRDTLRVTVSYEIDTMVDGEKLEGADKC